MRDALNRYGDAANGSDADEATLDNALRACIHSRSVESKTDAPFGRGISGPKGPEFEVTTKAAVRWTVLHFLLNRHDLIMNIEYPAWMHHRAYSHSHE